MLIADRWELSLRAPHAAAAPNGPKNGDAGTPPADMTNFLQSCGFVVTVWAFQSRSLHRGSAASSRASQHSSLTEVAEVHVQDHAPKRAVDEQALRQLRRARVTDGVVGQVQARERGVDAKAFCQLRCSRYAELRMLLSDRSRLVSMVWRRRHSTSCTKPALCSPSRAAVINKASSGRAALQNLQPSPRVCIGQRTLRAAARDTQLPSPEFAQRQKLAQR